MEFFLFLPQMRVTFDKLTATAKAAEAAGFAGMVGMDHIEAPRGIGQSTFESTAVNMWIAAQTQKLKVGSLVTCDAFRHPALLAHQAVSIDHASNGRFELGIGWGSWDADFQKFGVSPYTPRERVARLKETLEVLKALWSGESVDYQGEYHTLRGAQLAPKPINKIPILIGGSGPKTLALVREHADWWNLDVRYRDKMEGGGFEDLRAQIGKARISLQIQIAYVGAESARAAVAETSAKRFGRKTPVVGNGAELAAHFSKLKAQGVERVYAWFTDFASPETLAGFGEQVIKPLA
jgi:alkanesulfonate monooxygenase SsuD/methylene tetrahydromethanopterin reductase-like flavin-dependent oxidoreductase (luciferase family)